MTRAHRLLPTAVAAALLSAEGCAGVRSTGGQVFGASVGGHSAKDAARASASGDLPCPVERVLVMGEGYSESSVPPLVVVQGCGERLTYAVSCDGGGSDCQCLLIARMKAP